MNATPLHRRPRRRERGSVLVVCLVLAGLGTLGVAAWISLLDARGQQVEATFAATERRVALGNGHSLARLAIYRNILHADSSANSDLVYTLPAGKGRAIIRPHKVAALSNDTEGPPARNGATPLSSRSYPLTVDLQDGTGTARWTYHLRNQHPALAGEILSLHAPVQPTDTAPLVSGRLHVKGRAAFWDAVVRDLGNGFAADEFLLPGPIAGPTTFTTPGGTSTLPLNYPHYLRTTGTTGAGAAYRGELELLAATANPTNAYETRLAAGGGPLQLELNVPRSDADGPGTLPGSPSDATHLAYIASNTPANVVNYLSSHHNLSSAVLLAVVAKANPALSPQQLHQVFNHQTTLPDDALTAMMAAIDHNAIPDALDTALRAMNEKHKAQYNNDGKGMVQIYLDHPGLSRVHAHGVSRLRLVGQPDTAKSNAAAALLPLLVVIDNRGGGSVLDRIDLLHENHRPLVLVVASAASSSPAMPVVRFSGSAFPVWRAVVDLQRTGLAFDLAPVSGARLLGGIRGNHRLTVGGGTLTLERETTPAVVDALAPFLSRDAWIEAVRQ